MNPWDETNDVQRGLGAAEADGGLLTVAQRPDALDHDPLSIFLASSSPLRTASAAPVRLRLDPPGGTSPHTARVLVDGREVQARFEGGAAIVDARPGRDHLVRWRIVERRAR